VVGRHEQHVAATVHALAPRLRAQDEVAAEVRDGRAARRDGVAHRLPGGQPRLDAAVAALGTSYAKLTIRNQRTRWGSCSSTGAMSFNWRLLLAPESVLDYVVWHEACHLRVMDHSPDFWALVRRHCPDYEDDRRWLRAKGNTLVF